MIIMMPDRKLKNVILLGVAFMFMYVAVATTDIIQSTITESIQVEDSSYDANAYTALAITYSCIAVSSWLAPSLVYYLTPKWTMVLAALPAISITIPALLPPSTALMYSLSAACGLGEAALWTGQGSFLTLNSDGKDQVRDWGIFWTLFQCSLLAGNLFIYFEFEGQIHISKSTRKTTLGALLAVGIAGVLLLCSLSPATESRDKGEELQVTQMVESAGETPIVPAEGRHVGCTSTKRKKLEGPWQALLASVRLLFTPNMALFCVMFLYLGVFMSFFTGVYGGAVGFTEQFGPDRTKFVGISGLLMGVGEISGGLIFGVLGNRTIILGRAPAVTLGSICHLAAYVATFLNLPDKSVFGTTGDLAFIDSQMWLAMTCSFMLGFGEATIQTQVNAAVSYMYPDDSGPAFALFQFSQCVAAAMAFFYSTVLGLYIQLLILSITCVAGTATFWVVSRRRPAAQQ